MARATLSYDVVVVGGGAAGRDLAVAVLGSARVIGVCLATGEAVGRAAARHADGRSERDAG